MHITHPATGVMVTTGIVGSIDADRQRPRAGGADPRRGSRRGRLLRRRRVEHRRVPRIAEPGCRVEAAGRSSSARTTATASTPGTSKATVPRGRRDRAQSATGCLASPSTATTRSRCMRGRAEADRACARRRRPDADRGHDLPLPRPRLRRRGRLHGQGEKDAAMARRSRCRASAPGSIADGAADRGRARRASRPASSSSSTKPSISRSRAPFPDVDGTASRRLCERVAGMSQTAQAEHRSGRQQGAPRRHGATTNVIRARRGHRPTPRRAASSASPAGCRRKYGDGRVRTTPISEQAIIGAAIGAAIVGYPAGRRDHADELHDGGDGHDRQPRGQAALHVRRPDQRADHDPHDDRRGLRHWRPARGLPRGLVRAHRRA